MSEDLIHRADGRIEWLCEHGVGHTIYNPHDWGKWSMSHGCDGCCSSDECKKVMKDLN